MNNYSSRHNPSPILPIGKVNLLTGNNKMFGKVWDCWERYNSTVILFERDTRIFPRASVTQYRAVVTSTHGKTPEEGVVSTLERHPIGSVHHFIHDQDRYYMGAYKVIGVFKHSDVGHKQIHEKIGATSVSFSTYK